jgi:DNA-binding CsgD family transcriptional regulator
MKTKLTQDEIWQKYAVRIQAQFNLSDRQTEAAIWALRGQENSHIAASMNISVETANKHLDAVYKKARVNSRSQLAATVLEDAARRN